MEKLNDGKWEMCREEVVFFSPTPNIQHPLPTSTMGLSGRIWYSKFVSVLNVEWAAGNSWKVGEK